MNYFLKKTFTIIFIATFVVAEMFFILSPKDAHALAAVVTDPGNMIQNSFTAVSTTFSSVSNYTSQYKDMVLDPIAYYAAQTLLQHLTTSIVNWINSGFEGSPSFITDPGGFFMDIADEEIGKFIAGSEDLQFLCSPFSLSIRLSLAFKYQPFKRKIGCTLFDREGRPGIISNVKDAGNNASINNFTAGDFKAGGWPTFVSMTTEPQNNGYGAYLEAESELAWRIGSHQSQKRDEISAGRGFLSWRGKECLRYSDSGNVDGSGNADTENVSNSPSGQTERKCEEYKINTPGSVIESGINNALPSGSDSLKVADEFNEIVNALFAQLVKMALTSGLSGLSGSGPSDPDSYLKAIEAEQIQKTEQFRSIQTQIIQGVQSALSKEYDYKNNKSASLDKIIVTNNKFQDVKACYINKIESGRLNDSQRSFANDKINTVDNIVETNLTPKSTQLIEELTETNTIINSLNGIKRLSETARSVDQFAPLSKEFSEMTPILHTIIDIGNAESEKQGLDEVLAPLDNQALLMERECSLFGNTGSTRN
jgi:hypothetical protein